MKQKLLTSLLCVAFLSLQSAKAEDYKYLTVGYNGMERSVSLDTVLKIVFKDGNVVLTTCEDSHTFPQTQVETIYFSETSTGIERVINADEMEEMVNGKGPNGKCFYDLSGRRVENPTKGLYIVGNKKVLIK